MTPQVSDPPAGPHGGLQMRTAGGGAAPPGAVSRAGALDACRRLSASLAKAADLETRQRSPEDDTIPIPLVKFVDALVRMRLAPALTEGWPGNDPVHIVLFGGTNSGKSTVLNLLLGRPVAGMAAIPRFSQHPEAFSDDLPADWFDRFPTRWSGYVKYVNQHPPRQSDAELRQGYRAAVALIRPGSSKGEKGRQGEGETGRQDEREAGSSPLLPVSASPILPSSAVLWDCPDFSTVQARAYFGAVIDAAALADVIVITVTTESYLDDRGGMLMNLLVDSGAAVHVVANKVSDDPKLLEDIRGSVGTNNRGARLEPAAVHPLPRVEENDPLRRLEKLLATPQGNALREAIRTDAERGRVLKRRTLIGCLDFLDRRLGEALGPLDKEANVGRFWEQAVNGFTQTVILDRYTSDYINTDRYSEFNRTLVRLMELIEVPVISDILKGATKILRIPLSWIKRKLSGPPKVSKPPEEAVLTDLIDKWISALRSEAQQRQEQQPHPGWAAIVGQLDSAAFRDRIFAEGFAAGYADYRRRLEEEERARAKALYDKLRESPVMLNGLRLFMAGLDAGALFLTIKTMGGLDWSDLVVGPIMLKVRRWFTEKGMGAYLETQKETLIGWQKQAVQTLVTEKLATPARGLFHSEVSTRDVEQAWASFQEIKAVLSS
jgi:hypothetical protein